MKNFIIGVLSSLAAMGIGFYLVLARKKGQAWLGHLLTYYSKIGIDRIYQTRGDAVEDLRIIKDQSRSIKIMAVRGNWFSNDSEEFYKIFFAPSELRKSKHDITILLANPYLDEPSNIFDSCAHFRAEERSKVDGYADCETYLLSMKKSVETLSRIISNNGKNKIMLYNEPTLLWMIIFESHIFFSFYSGQNPLEENRIFRARIGSDLYSAFIRYFDSVGQKSSTKSFDISTESKKVSK